MNKSRSEKYFSAIFLLPERRMAKISEWAISKWMPKLKTFPKWRMAMWHGPCPFTKSAKIQFWTDHNTNLEQILTQHGIGLNINWSGPIFLKLRIIYSKFKLIWLCWYIQSELLVINWIHSLPSKSAQLKICVFWFNKLNMLLQYVVVMGEPRGSPTQPLAHGEKFRIFILHWHDIALCAIQYSL